MEKTDWTGEEYFAGVGLDTEFRYELVREKVYAMATPTAAHAEIPSKVSTDSSPGEPSPPNPVY